MCHSTDALAIDNADSYDEFISQLFLMRKLSGLTVEDVARKMGVGVKYLERVEAGHGDPGIRFLMSYAEVVGAFTSFRAVLPSMIGEHQRESRSWTSQLNKMVKDDC